MAENYKKRKLENVLEGLMLKPKLQAMAIHCMKASTNSKKDLMLRKMEMGEGDDRGRMMDGCL